MKIDKRLQGTDGIRGKIVLSTDKVIEGLHPLEAYVEKGILTEEFFELYAYSTIKLLSQNENGKIIVIVGYDPRDVDGVFTESICNGLRKAGADVINIGLLPTPAIPFYVVYRRATAGIMITASHNPKEQNGIKIFYKYYGLKLYPKDDMDLTNIIYQCYKEKLSLEKHSITGKLLFEHEKAKHLFLDYISDKRNSLITYKMELDKYIVVGDCANGCYSEILSDALSRIGIKDFTITNNRLDGSVNVDSGVAELEGYTEITRKLYRKEFSAFKTLTSLFSMADKYREELIAGNKLLIGLVFDADGDRFFRLDYISEHDTFNVSTGDETAILQAKHFSSFKRFSKERNKFVTTVESDLNAIVEVGKLGYNGVLTGVGDKWLLLQVMKMLFEKYKDVINKYNILCEKEVHKIENIFNSVKISSIELTNCMLRLEHIINEAKVLNDSLMNEIVNNGEMHFVGSEESGHNITAGYFCDIDDKPFLVFSGNGLKSAINTLAATDTLQQRIEHKKYVDTIMHPFSKGYKQTFYVYFTKKNKLYNGSEVWKALLNKINEIAKIHIPGIEEISVISMTEEPDMLYVKLSDESSGLVAGIFIRNSGTEDKTGINIRGNLIFTSKFDIIGRKLCKTLWKIMKNEQHPYSIVENKIIDMLIMKEDVTEEDINRLFSDDVDLKEILKIMYTKEKVIRYVDGIIRLSDGWIENENDL